MKMKTILLALTLVLSLNLMAYAQNEELPEQISAPTPAQIFPNDIERTLEDSERNEREMKEYKKKLKEKNQPK